MPKRNPKNKKNKHSRKGKHRRSPGDSLSSGRHKVVLGSHQYASLKYIDGNDQRASPGLNFALWRLRLNDVFDPDPLVLTGGITGYIELTSIFNRWRVSSSAIHASVVNRETFPLHFGVLVSPTDLSTVITSRALALDALERPGCLFHKELAAQGGMDRLNFSRNIAHPKLLGDSPTYFAGDFDGTALASPARNLFVTFILVAPVTVGTIANGVFYDLNLVYHVKFFDVIPKLLGLSEEQQLELKLLRLQRRRLYAASQTTSALDLRIKSYFAPSSEGH